MSKNCAVQRVEDSFGGSLKGLLDVWDKSLPPAFGRSEIEVLLPGIISSKTLANLESMGSGPPSYRNGRRVFYERGSFLTWLSTRIRRVEA